jgi:putative ATP-binding cassette transporter
VPYIIQAPRYFSGAITLGDLTQTATAFGQVSDSLSFFRSATTANELPRRPHPAQRPARRRRRHARALPSVTLEPGDDLDVHHLTAGSPTTRCWSTTSTCT